MPAERTTGYQQAVAERNIEAILDAATELLQQRAQVSISAVAKHAGLSRVTLYAHFPTWEALLEAAVERAVGQTMAAVTAAGPGNGPPVQALERVLTAAWQHLARYGAMAQAVAEQLGPDAVTRTHQAAHQMIHALLERGQADGSFRTDLPAGWLITAAITLIHACAAEVRADRISQPAAPAILTATIRDLFTGPAIEGQGQTHFLCRTSCGAPPVPEPVALAGRRTRSAAPARPAAARPGIFPRTRRDELDRNG